jgi:two-component system, NtrC family, sensor kinase
LITASNHVSDSAVHTEIDPLFVESLPWPAAAISDSGMVLYINEALLRSSGPALYNQCVLFSEMFPEYHAALRGAPPWLHEQEAEVRRQAQGMTCYEHLYLRRYHNSAYLIVVDETRLQELEQERTQSARLASMGFMLAGICHEINNPLTAIHSLLQILQSKTRPTADVLDKGLAMIAANITRIIDITRSINNFARSGDNQRVAMRIDWAIQESLLLVRQDMRFGQIEVDYQGDPESYVIGNLGQLQQVFLNIFINAIQAMAGQGKLTIRTRRPAGSGQVEVAVQDTGPGIPVACMDRLFDPFFTTKPQGQGTGIGLAISKDIITKHGGTLSAASTAGQGAVFSIRLPATDASAHE